MRSSRIPLGLWMLGLAAAYYGAAKLGLSLASFSPSVTAVWAPTGISLAALILFGYRLWPGVALGAFLANLGTGVPFLTVLGITAGNTLEALVGAYLLVRVARFEPRLDRVRDIVSLAILAAGVSTAVSATFGTGSLLLGDEIEGGDFGMVWRTWWLGDMGGDLVVAPALMVAVTRWPYRLTPERVLEILALLGITAGAAALVFTQERGLAFTLIPLAMLAVFRFHQAGALGTSLVVAAVGIPLTESGDGPYGALAPDDRLLLTTVFLGISCMSMLLLAAVVSERERAMEGLRRIATTLQESLLPEGLPALPGIETAVDFRPAGDGQIVGGDFYDLITDDNGSYGVVVGDALGKGPDAAAETALARYTLRAAAVLERKPSRILEILNEAVLRQAPGRPCTVAYARLDRTGDGASVTVALGGHPMPLILRHDGEVEQIGTPGLPLGVREQIKLADHWTQLRPGDALLLYTDGLTDARAPEHVVSVAELSEALRPHAGAEPREILDAVRALALGGSAGELRDDILVLVLRLRPETPPA